MLSLFNPGILHGIDSTNSDGAPYLSAAPGPGASQEPAAPQSAEALIDTLSSILSQTCQAAYAQGRQLSDAWREQVADQGPAKFANDLAAFRDHAAQCLGQIGDLLNHTDPAFSDITSTVAGSWTFAAPLWIATNDFADAVASDSSITLPERIAKARSQSKNFAIALDQFSQWITERQGDLSKLPSRQNGAPQ